MEMFKSATRVTLLIIILTLVGINVFAVIKYPDTVFLTTWALFKDIALMSATYFYSKSTFEASKQSQIDEKRDEPFIV
tara:strand:+ start:8466 stop:8699 length:234 start_codon:yes stop_codon:yes gene_type:complete